MITPAELYAATNDGLDIICLHFPEARECARTNGAKKFKVRSQERTPSATVKRFSSKAGGAVWKLTDFGGEGRAVDPIQLHMDQTGLRFYEAVLDLAQQFNVTAGNINRAVNKPEIRYEDAREDQPDGSCFWELTDEFTDEQCRVMGPKVKPEHLKELHWYVAKYVATVKNRQVRYEGTTPTYPIFMRECWFTDAQGKRDRFYKVYKPLNPEKQWRFSYQPRDKKPQSYINGLSELAAAWTKLNEAEEKAFNADPANEGKTYREKKLSEAIICSGERDALCVKSIGYHPLWFNSETYHVSEAEYGQITRYVERVYNIPDIDITGRLKGSQLALDFIDINTIWLPDKLLTMRDNRGKPRKDFRDWIEIYREKRDFKNLMDVAAPARFWTTKYNDKGEARYAIDTVCLHNFLNLNGFFTLRDKHAAARRFIRITGNVVTEVQPKEIRDFVTAWAQSTGQPRGLRNLILTSTQFSTLYLEGMQEVDPDFTSYTPTSQTFYFPKFAAEVTAEGIVKHDAMTSGTGRFVWNDKVIEHPVKLLDDMFTITHPEGKTHSEDFDIEIKDLSSTYFRCLLNSSRLYWRKELETAWAERPEAQAEAYRQAHRFDIAGPELTAAEIAEQKQCLISKIFTIGYMLHRFKSKSRNWAPFLMDNLIGENDQCNGRSGKSFMIEFLKNFVNEEKLSGRNPKLLENNFAFERINKATDLVLVDDCHEYLPIKSFYDVISSDMTINTKNVASYTLRYEDAPRFAFTSNYVPKEFDQSSRDRMLYLVFSDYYHVDTEENDYLETRKIRDDAGKDVGGATYTDEEWNADINFVMQCVRFYLSVAGSNIKIEPKLDNIIFRKRLRDMSENFRDWAEGYFSPERGNLDVEIRRDKVLNDYMVETHVSKVTMKTFTKSLKAFCFTCEWTSCLNPKDVCNTLDGKRIVHRCPDPLNPTATPTKEFLYVRSMAEEERLNNPAPPPPKQTDMPF